MATRLTKVQREILRLMASAEDGDGDIVEDYDHPGWIYLANIEPYRYVDWRTLNILVKNEWIISTADRRERYRWTITEAGRRVAPKDDRSWELTQDLTNVPF